MNTAEYLPVDNPVAYIKDLRSRGFVRVRPDRNGVVKFKGLKRRIPGYTPALINDARKLKGFGRLVAGCFAKDHGIFSEMHHLGVVGRNRVRIDRKLCVNPLGRLTDQLSDGKVKTLKLRRNLDEIRRRLLRDEQDAATRIIIFNGDHSKMKTATRALDDHIARLGELIAKKCAAFMGAFSVEQSGKVFFTFHYAENKGEMGKLAKFYVAFEDARSLISMKDSGGDHGGKGGPSMAQGQQIVIWTKKFTAAAVESMENHYSDPKGLARIENSQGIDPGSLNQFHIEQLDSDATPASWAAKMAYMKVMKKPGTGSAVKKIAAKLRRRR